MPKLPFRKRRFRSKRLVRRRPINVLASALTCAGLYCGMASILAGIDGKYAVAAYYIVGAIVFDILDGSVAKLTKSVSEFGKQLDSLCDLVSFGAAPAVLIYTAYLAEERAGGSPVGHYGAIMAIIYVICGALRLARFNVYQAEVRDFFTGLPIPGAALTVASFVLFTDYWKLHVAFWVLGPMTLGLAYLMVSTVRYPKDRMRSLVLAPKNAIRLLFLCAVLIAVAHRALQLSAALVLLPIAVAYLLYGPVDELLAWLNRRPVTLSEPAQSIEKPDEPTGAA
mgnify:CR=1 FL=1